MNITLSERTKAALIIALLLTILITHRLCNRSQKQQHADLPSTTIDYGKTFNDRNDIQLKAATTNGISPIKKKTGVEKAADKYSLKKMSTNKKHVIDRLTHSSPYLTGSAATLLDDLGQAFADTLTKRNLPPYRFIVTSLLRTEEEQSQLSRGNVNATQNSAHLYATTFDITYARFKSPSDPQTTLNEEQLKALLASVLLDFKKQKRCYVKHEVRQKCFHITAR